MLDLYRLLGLKRGATTEEVRRAYRRRAKTSHPDGGGSVEQFSTLATAYEVLSDEKRREKYDATGEIEPARPSNFDGRALEVIAQKLGLVIHAEHDVTALDIGLLIEQSIRDDIASRKCNISDQVRAIARVRRLRARVRCRAAGGDNALARVLDWHEHVTKDHIKKNEEAVSSMERALEILEGYSFSDDFPSGQDQVSAALRDTIQTLDDLAAILNATPKAAVG